MSTAPIGAAARGLPALIDLLRSRRVVVLAGAGCSTESGIPDYRGPESRNRTRKPMQYGAFVRSADARRRYWARSAVGWRRVHEAKPNAAHTALAELEAAGIVRGVITQNVDGLHQAGGSRRVVELHGSLAQVACLDCGSRSPRTEMQRRIVEANGSWPRRRGEPAGSSRGAEPAPDGDADLPAADVASFVVPECDACGGVLKPDVVFFGESVPKPRVEEAWRLFGEGEALLVVGSSLTVFSGRRFVYRAAERRVPVGIVNLGPTRADDLAAAKVEERLGLALPRVARRLLDAPPAVPASGQDPR